LSYTEKVISIFREISQIPRGSGNETGISNWLVSYAQKHNWEVSQDRALNVVIRVPGTGIYADRDGIILQGHMDMVCVRDAESKHDFLTDPIKFIYDGEWLTADKTTLGADNGVSLAIALAIATEPDLAHPPLELLFTSDEERGLVGAKSLAEGVLTGKYLINIDNGIDGVFTIGCAGGRDALIELPLTLHSYTDEAPTFELSINKLSGGHSGIQIGEKKANAIQLLARFLERVLQSASDFSLCSITGGIAHNAIPTDASAVFSTTEVNLVQNIERELFELFERDFRAIEPNMVLSIKRVNTHKKNIDRETTKRIVSLLLSIPHGVFAMSPQMSDLVETSSNLAQIGIKDDKFQTLISLRSSLESQINFLGIKLKVIAEMAGATFHLGVGYPAWEPRFDASLLKKSVSAYQRLFGCEPTVDVIHAGLEPGVIGSKYPEIEMIAIGPTIKNCHTTSEKVKIADLDKTMRLIIEIFGELT
jgi:dipeptidase D